MVSTEDLREIAANIYGEYLSRDFEFSDVYEDDEGRELSSNDQDYVYDLILGAKVHFDLPDIERASA
jgi:hypothetical protein